MLRSGVFEKGKLDLLNALPSILAINLSEEIGCVLIFIGVARGKGKGGRRVVKLEMESYKEHANLVLRKICSEVKKEFKVQLVLIQHLIGEFRVGEPVVLVVVGGARRKNVLAAMGKVVERYKTEPALFKKEVYLDGSHQWIY